MKVKSFAVTSTAIIVVSLFAWAGFSSCESCQGTYRLIMKFMLENECLSCGQGTGSDIVYEKFRVTIGDETTVYDGDHYAPPTWSLAQEGVDADAKETINAFYARICRSNEATTEINQMLFSAVQRHPMSAMIILLI